MIRAVLDPGVLIAGLISREGTPAHLLREWLNGCYDLVVSPHLIVELTNTLRREKFRKYVSIEEAEAFVAILERLAIVASDPDEIPNVTKDRDDDYLVALSLRTRCDALVSGDKHLTGEEELSSLVTTPRRFAESLRTQLGRVLSQQSFLGERLAPCVMDRGAGLLGPDIAAADLSRTG